MTKITRLDHYAAPIIAAMVRRAACDEDWANVIPTSMVIARRAIELSDQTAAKSRPRTPELPASMTPAGRSPDALPAARRGPPPPKK